MRLLVFLLFATSVLVAADPSNFFVGCYTDYTSRTLPTQQPGKSYTPSSCISECSKAGFVYSGLQNGGECWCGQTLPSVISTSCTMNCTANAKQICGGYFANSVYVTSVYQGCFSDTSSRTFPFQVDGKNYVSSTCITACAAAGYSYAGLQNGGQCFCGKTLPSTPATTCNMSCWVSSYNCGGSMASAVYSVPPNMLISYKGCLADNDSVLTRYTVTSAHTPQACINACSQAGYVYAGLKIWGACYCGNTLPTTPSRECTSLCWNDLTQTCGGRDYSIYSTLTLPTYETVKSFFPNSVHFALEENCIEPASSSGSNGVAFYYAQAHPRNVKVAMVTYGLLFKQDCGHAGHSGANGVGGHPGDGEFFTYTLIPDSTCTKGWKLFSIKTAAHSSDYQRREINENRIQKCTPPEKIVSSLGKHALYLSWGDCSKRTPAEVCLDGFSVPASGFQLYNANVPGLAPNLAHIMALALGKDSNGKDKVWSSEGDGYFTGGQTIGDRSDGVDAPGGHLSKKSNEWDYPDPNTGDDQRCPYGLDWDAGLCYKYCDEGYTGAATMCIPDCQGSGWTDIGLYCNKDTYGRGVGTVPDRCPSGYHQSGALCYKDCRSGYHALGTVCWGSCPSGYTDTGALCQANTYGKGCCCTVFGCCGCRSGYTDMGCFCQTSGPSTKTKPSYENSSGLKSLGCADDKDEYAGLCYDKCNDGYSNSGCCICMKRGCPPHTIDIGVSCQKVTYDRGVGCLP